MEDSQKYRPMWKAEGFLSPRLGDAEAPPFGKGGLKAPLPKGAGTAGEPPVAFAVTEGFTVEASQKYRPMWKAEGFLSPRPGKPGHPPLARGA